MSSSPEAVLPLERLARLENFGHSLKTPAYVYQPAQIAQLHELFELARRQNLSIALRGAGRSYGDAALNSGQIVLDLQGLNHVLDWDPTTGRIRVEPGVTIEQLWKHVLAAGWWPPVVPGTMFPTLGGCLAANVHGKNNWKAGPLGEHVIEFEALLPNGMPIKCSPTQESELFYAMIGGMGLLGVFTSITLQLKRIYSGNLEVNAWAEPHLTGMLRAVDEHKESDYIVGWVDCIASGASLGRGQIHSARYLKTGEDPNAELSLKLKSQDVPERFFGVVPKEIMPVLMLPFINNFGTWAVNTAKYLANRTIGNHKTFRESLVSFSFLLDHYPIANLGGKGFIQYQSFLPKETAADAYFTMLQLCKRAGLPSYAGVLKRHRPDKFLLTHSLDGYSLALDFRVTRSNRRALLALASELDELVLAAGGRFYFAKDSTLRAESVERYLGRETVSKFRKLKNQTDPDNILQSDLYRRCFNL